MLVSCVCVCVGGVHGQAPSSPCLPSIIPELLVSHVAPKHLCCSEASLSLCSTLVETTLPSKLQVVVAEPASPPSELPQGQFPCMTAATFDAYILLFALSFLCLESCSAWELARPGAALHLNWGSVDKYPAFCLHAAIPQRVPLGGPLVAHSGDPLTNILPSLESLPMCTQVLIQRLLLGELDFHPLGSLERSRTLQESH